MKTTVAIPLHRSAPWTEVVAANIERLTGVAQVVVSDPDESDGALDALRERFAAVGVEFVGGRPLAAGWTVHCNDLLARCSTPYAMWLPHDDEISADWILEAERALDAEPGASLAIGSIDAIGDGVAMPFNPAYASRDPRQRAEAALADFVSGRATSLGLLFRGVMRRELAVPLPLAEPWADVPWAIGMLVAGSAVPTSAIYRKRWHPSSASAGWSSQLTAPGLRATQLVDALRPLAPEHADLIALAWEQEIAQMHGHHVFLDGRIARLEGTFATRLARAPGRAAAGLRLLRDALRSPSRG